MGSGRSWQMKQWLAGALRGFYILLNWPHFFSLDLGGDGRLSTLISDELVDGFS